MLHFLRPSRSPFNIATGVPRLVVRGGDFRQTALVLELHTDSTLTNVSWEHESRSTWDV